MDVKISSKKVTSERRKIVSFDDSLPIPELEIISQKRTTQVIDKVPSEELTEDMKMHEEKIVHKSEVRQTVGERLKIKTVAPRFTQRVEPVVVEEGKPISLVCKVEGSPFPDITWYKNEKVFYATERVFVNIVEDTVTLEFSKVEPHDVAIYSCKASNPAGVATSTANVVILEKEETGTAPHFVQPLKPQIVEEKSIATLRCTVTGQPTPKIRWLKEGKEIVPSPTRKMSYNPETGEATLEILEPQPDDEKVYSVKAENKFGKAECRANLIISESISISQPITMQAPKITKPVQAIVVKPSEEIVLEADFEGTPKPEITWLRNGTEIKPDKDYQIETKENKTVLRVKKKVSKKQKGGKYEVRAVNPKGEARSSGSVMVIEEINEAQPPRFIESIKPQQATVGEVVIFESLVEAVPKATFQWFQDSTPIVSSPQTRIVSEDNKSILMISEVTPGYAGAITCRAENAVGSVTCTASLNVFDEVEWQETKEVIYPRFVKRLSPVRVMDGEKVQFSCVVTGKPIPKVEWYHNDLPVKEAKDVVISQDSEGLCTLAISEVFPENAGVYTCIAMNRAGEAVCKSSLIVEAYEYVPDSELGHMTGSEEDLLADKTISSETDIQSDSDVEFAPRITKKLPQVVATKDGDVTRLEVTAVGKPKPEGRWLKHGEEIIPSKEFIIENFEDGTSILTITEVFPDDTGEIVYEAENSLGVAISSTELLVETVEGIMGTKEYRKPEWVTHMEELSAALKGNSNIGCDLTHVCSYEISADSLETISKITPDIGEGKVTRTDFKESYSTQPFYLHNAPVSLFENLSDASTLSEPSHHLSKPKNDFVNVTMTDYLNSHRHSLSSVMELLDSSNVFHIEGNPNMIENAESQEQNDACAIIRNEDFVEVHSHSDSFYILSPIEEKSETSTRSSSLKDSNGSDKNKYRQDTLGKYSSSCNALPRDFTDTKSLPEKYQTFPRVKHEMAYKDDGDYDNSYNTNNTLYPLEPRELDPNSFFQLHTADSQEELQEFLLLESECMADNNRGLASAFVTSTDSTHIFSSTEASQTPPTFVQEITDIRTTEAETIKFECLFSGTPKPDIIWYHNEKIIRNTKRVKVRIEENKTSVTITEASDEDVGTYVCKAVSEIGAAVTKAKLYVQEIPEYKKQAIIMRRAKEEDERLKKERVKIEKKKMERKQRVTVTTEEEIKPLDVTEVQAIETTKDITETKKEARAKPTLDIQEPLRTEAIATAKKIDEYPEKLGEEAKELLSPAEATYLEQILTEEIIKDIEKILPRTQKATPTMQTGVSEFVDITEVNLDQIIERCEKVIRHSELKMAKVVSQMLKFVRAKDFGPGETPLREIAEIGYLMNNGITVKEVTVLYDEDKFPSLKSPQAQSAMVNVVERKGHGALISEVLTEETTIDERKLAATVGFRAFMKMVEANYVTIEEVITSFTPEDFIQRAWESSEATEETMKSISEMVTITEEVEVMEGSSRVVEKLFKKKDDIEEITEVEEDAERLIKREDKRPEKKYSVEITDITDSPVNQETEIKEETQEKIDTEFEIVEETKRTRITKKKSKISKPKTAEYELDDEDVEILEPFNIPARKEIPLSSSTIVSEAVNSGEVAQISSDSFPSNANIDILPHTAITEEQIQAHDMEKIHVDVTASTAKADRSVDKMEAIEISEQNVQDTAHHFDRKFVAITSNAGQMVESNEGLIINEVTLGDTSTTIDDFIFAETKAMFSVLPQQALNVSETEISLKEDLLDLPIIESQTPLSIHNTGIFSEANTSSEVAHIDKSVEESRANMEIIPNSAIMGESTHTDEKEGTHRSTEITFSTAMRTLDTVEAFEITQTTPQSSTREFENQPTFISSRASTQITPSEGIQVQEYNLGDVPYTLAQEQTIEDSAVLTLIPQEAKNVSEVHVSDREKDLEIFPKPKEVHAEGSVTTKESLNVEEVNQGIFEGEFDLPKTTSIKPKYKIDSREPIIVENVQAEIKPGKHLPEAFVPTEIATKNIVSQKAIFQSEINAPEIEGEYILGKLPPLQAANMKITVGEGLIISQTNTSEKEIILEKAEVGETANAIPNFTICEGISVTITDSQQPQTDVPSEDIQQQAGNIEISPLEPIVSQTILVNESEMKYEEEKPPSKTANTSFNCLQTTSKTLTIAQESEHILSAGTQPTKSTAIRTVSPNESITIQEIEASDFPEDFKNYPKLKTDNASENYETQYATDITEILTGEREATYHELPQEYLSLESSLTRPQEQVEIRESQILETEKNLKDFELPDSHKVKQVRTTLLPTSVTEETTIEHSIDKLEAIHTEEGKASYKHPLSSEITISETIAVESTNQIKRDLVEKKEALSVFSPQDALNVQEVLAIDKEQQFINREIIGGEQATLNIDTQQVASKSVTQTNDVADSMKLSEPLEATAVSKHGAFETLQVLEYETAEKEGEYSEILPETKKAVVDLTESSHGANIISQIFPNEKEDLYESQPKALQVLASMALTTQEVFVTSEVESVVHADSLQEEELVTGKAKKYAKPFTELIVTETNVTDVERSLAADIVPLSKTAYLEILPGQALTVIETISDHKETELGIPEIETTLANVTIDEQLVAVTEQAQAASLPGELNDEQPEKQNAFTSRDISVSVMQLQITPGEKEGEKLDDITPDKKQAIVSLSEVEGLKITEVTVEDQEDILHEARIPEAVEGKTSMNALHPSALSEIKKLYRIVYQWIASSPESTTFENEEELYEMKPTQKNAHSEYQHAEGLFVTSVISSEKEETLKRDSPDLKTADSSLLSQDVVEVRETLASDTIKDLEIMLPIKVSAITGQFELQSLINTETVPGDTVSTLTLDGEPTKQMAAIELENLVIPEVSETILSEKENIYQTPEVTETKTATQSLSAHLVAEKSEIEGQDSFSHMIGQDLVSVEAHVDQSPMESIISTKPFIQESETYFERVEVPTEKAHLELREDYGINITHITSNETEFSFPVFDKPLEIQASVGLESHIIPLKTETEANYTTDDMIVSEPHQASAHPEIYPLKTALKHQTIPSEMEDVILEVPKPDMQQVSSTLDEDSSILVESVLVHDKEVEFAEKPSEEKHAQTNISDAMGVIMQSEAKVEYGLAHVTDVIPCGTKATQSSIPFDSAFVSEEIPLDKETNLPINEKESALSASINIQASETITTTEAILGQKENYLDEFKLPDRKSAHTSMDVTQKVAELNITDVSDSLSRYNTPQPESGVANQEEESLRSLIVSENVTEEKEISFSGKFQPITSQVNVTLEQKIQGVNVSEILIQEKEGHLEELEVPYKEGNLDKFEIPKQQRANLEVDTITIPQNTVTELEENFEDLISLSKEFSIANMEQLPHQVIVETQHQIQEKEGIYDGSSNVITKTAEFILEDNTALSTTEVRTVEKEKAFEEGTKPETTVALPSIIPNKSTQITETLTNMSLDKLDSGKTTPVTAVPISDISESLVQSIPLVIENTTSFEGTFKFNVINAQERIDSLSELTVSETYPEAIAKTLTEFTDERELATSNIDTSKAVESSEVFTSENTSSLIIDSKTASNITVRRDTFDSILLTENLIHESEKDLEKVLPEELKYAEKILPEISPLNISEVLGQETETPFACDQIKQEVLSTNIIENNHLAQSIVIAQDTIDTFGAILEQEGKAHESHTQLKSVIVSTKNIQERETALVNEYPETKKVTVEFLPDEGISVIETVPNEREEMLKDESTDSLSAEQIITSQEATQISEITVEQDLQKLDIEFPDENRAYQDQGTYVPLDVTEILVAERESTFEATSKPDTLADVVLEKPAKTATKMEIQSTQSEFPLNLKKPDSESATPIFTEYQVIGGDDVSVMDSLGNLKLEEHIPRRATSQKDVFHSITETNIFPHGNTESINTEIPLSRTAEMNMNVQESIIVTDTMIHGQTGEEIKEVSASESTAIKEIEEKLVLVREENIPLQSHDFIEPEKLKVGKGQRNYAGMQHGLIVTEQITTGTIEQLECDSPTSRKVEVVLDVLPPSLQISEALLHEQEGSLDETTKHNTQARITRTSTQMNMAEHDKTDIQQDTDTEEIQEIVTNFRSSGDGADNIAITKRRTIMRSKNRTIGEGDVVVEEVLDEIPQRQPDHQVDIQEIETVPEGLLHIEELPEEVSITHVTSDEGEKNKMVTKKSVIKKHKNGTQEQTEIPTVEEEVEEEGKTSDNSYVEELEAPEEHYQKNHHCEELPEEVQVTHMTTDEGDKKKLVTKKRIIKKHRDGKQERTEILTVEEEGKEPQTTVTVEELEAPEDTLPGKPIRLVEELPEEVQKPIHYEELPEEVQVTYVTTDEGDKKKLVTKKRVIKKHRDGKQEKTEILTVEEEGKEPQKQLPLKNWKHQRNITEKHMHLVEELPEEIQVTHVTTDGGRRKAGHQEENHQKAQGWQTGKNRNTHS
ncbi:hypothetical protein JTB14_030235 [Gonioctena quinquepunctata]|nr:hypothetical protein JTB14_030235 [Gonioctena quinquepunctata]